MANFAAGDGPVANSDPDFDENEGWAEPKVSITDLPSERLRPSEPFSNEEARVAARREYLDLREALPPLTDQRSQSAVHEELGAAGAAGVESGDALALSLAGFGQGEEHDAWIEGAKLGMTGDGRSRAF